MLKPNIDPDHWYVYEDGTHRRHHTDDTTTWPLTIDPLDVITLWKLHNPTLMQKCSVLAPQVDMPGGEKPGVTLWVGDHHVQVYIHRYDPEGIFIWRREDVET